MFSQGCAHPLTLAIRPDVEPGQLLTGKRHKAYHLAVYHGHKAAQGQMGPVPLGVVGALRGKGGLAALQTLAVDVRHPGPVPGFHGPNQKSFHPYTPVRSKGGVYSSRALVRSWQKPGRSRARM